MLNDLHCLVYFPQEGSKVLSMGVPSMEVIEFMSRFTAQFETQSNGTKVSCLTVSRDSHCIIT